MHLQEEPSITNSREGSPIHGNVQSYAIMEKQESEEAVLILLPHGGYQQGYLHDGTM